MPEVLVNGARLFYEEMGSGPETIVFSHSYLLDSHHFNAQMQALRDRYRCVAFDHRGHGRSEVTETGYDMENLYSDAVMLIEALKCAPCHFVGLSTGGFIGLRIAIRRADLLRSLILMDTSADPEPEENLKQYKLLMFIVKWVGWRPVVGKVMPIFFAKKFLSDPARQNQVKEWKGRIMSSNKKAMVKFGQGIFGRVGVYEELPNIKIPTLMIVGEEDAATPADKAKRIAENVPGAKLVVIPGAGHLCTVEEPTAVTAAMELFLSSHSQA
jgi:pimeloyl-ACP methyl ester carboxylesterase